MDRRPSESDGHDRPDHRPGAPRARDGGDVGAAARRSDDREAVRAAKALDYLANERTLVAWVRLGVTIIVLGFVVARFGIFLNQIAIQQRQPAIGPGFTLPIGVTLVLGGALLTVLAGVRFFRVEHDIEAERLRRRYLLIYALLAAGTLISIALAVYLILAQLTSTVGRGG